MGRIRGAIKGSFPVNDYFGACEYLNWVCKFFIDSNLFESEIRARESKIKEDIMQQDEQEDKTIYKVVVNHEEQYSIWPVDRENALGWTDEGKSGSKEECLAHIKEVWTDMRPLSLRKKMEKMDINS